MEPLGVAVAILASALLVVLVVPWLRSHSYEALPRRPLLATVNWSLVLLYLVLTIVAVDLGWWVVYHATFGRVHPDGPSEPMLVLSGLAAMVTAGSGILLPIHRLAAAVMAFGGLTVAIAAFASGIQPADGTSTPLWWSDLVGIGLAVGGMFLLARSARA